MPLNESSRNPRERLNADFSRRDANSPKESIFMTQSKNSFAVDKATGDVLSQLFESQKDALLQQLLNRPTGREFDLNAPVLVRVPHQEFPRMVYHHGSGRVAVANNVEEFAIAQKRGFQAQPAPNRDYSKISLSGIAAIQQEAEEREKELSDEEIAALEQQEADAAAEQAKRAKEAESEQPQEQTQVEQNEQSAPEQPLRRRR